MGSAIYAAYTGLLARTQALDVAANNLANTSTSGYRAERPEFRGVLAEAQSALPSQIGSAVNHFGVLGGTALSSEQGQLTVTAEPLDMALRGGGFFAVKTPNGIRYTRDGHFGVDQNGTLQTEQGYSVLDTQGKPVTLPAGAATVGADGSISIATPQGAAIVAQVAVVDLGAQGAVRAEGAALYRAASGANAKPAVDTTVVGGALENSNEDAVHGTMKLMLTARQAETMQKALGLIDNDMDKAASEQIARV